MFKPVPIEIINNYNFPIENHPFCIGVPFPKGAIFSRELINLDFKGEPKQFDVAQLATWPDGSLKWILLDFQASVEANDQSLLHLVSDKDAVNRSRYQSDFIRTVINEVGDECLVDTGAAQFTISKHGSGFFDQVMYDNNNILSDTSSCVQLIDEGGSPAILTVSTIKFPDPENTLRRQVDISGFFQNNREEKLADFNVTLTFYAGHATVKCEVTLLNTRAAKHPGGVWDLGDNGSFFFKELSVNVQLAKGGCKYQPFIKITPDADWRSAPCGSLTLEQHSSGGKNWQSKNHVNLKGEVLLEYKGFRYFEQGVQMDSGSRAAPCVHLTSGASGVTARIVDFWQNFPKSIQVEQSTLSLCLFPRKGGDNYELQGGERKKHTFYLDFSNKKESLDEYINEIIPRIPLGCYSETKVIPWLPKFHETSITQKLIERGIQGDHNFFDKRETIDEFGWRNFGEIFADHEGLEYKGGDELISHYNNQYDPLYGFIKQYLITGDNRWYELLSALAQHIVDIDIYHTVNDRDEYNGGLFWHTHHYLTAFTCTHRTFSCKHADDFIYGEIGGGPGAEHCYTTGLSYYYFMTGDEIYKDAALQLVSWISRVLEGSGTLVERIFKFKSKDLPIVKRLISGESVQRYSYPFTRATGNYITSLIDAYCLTGDRHYMFSVERVIQQSIHPLDDISLRNLHDTESSWSYLIHLQAVCKYLDLKVSLQEIDGACLYARDCLLHYVDWMIDNESPYLQNPDRLEYPNHTWTAQDLRKANLFYIASMYSDDKKTKYLEKAHFYVRFVEDILKNEETRYFSRILILLMQNATPEFGLDYDAGTRLRNITASNSYPPAPLYSLSGVLLGFIMDIGSRIRKLSVRNERRWLSFRVR